MINKQDRVSGRQLGSREGAGEDMIKHIKDKQLTDSQTRMWVKGINEGSTDNKELDVLQTQLFSQKGKSLCPLNNNKNVLI